MNASRIYLIVVLLIAFGVCANGQETPKAVLVDEHGMLPCDDNLSRIDFWYAELSNNPNSVGLAVIATSPAKKHLGVFRELMMKAHANFRGAANHLDLKYVRAISESDFNVQLWKVPPGATQPQIERVDMSYSLPNEIKPFMLGADYKFGDQICPNINEEPIFSDFLKANPTARGNIVVRERTTEKARKRATQVLRVFQNQYGITRRRLRAFPATLTRPSNHDEPIVEYWYLP